MNKNDFKEGDLEEAWNFFHTPHFRAWMKVCAYILGHKDEIIVQLVRALNVYSNAAQRMWKVVDRDMKGISQPVQEILKTCTNTVYNFIIMIRDYSNVRIFIRGMVLEDHTKDPGIKKSNSKLGSKRSIFTQNPRNGCDRLIGHRSVRTPTKSNRLKSLESLVLQLRGIEFRLKKFEVKEESICDMLTFISTLEGKTTKCQCNTSKGCVISFLKSIIETYSNKTSKKLFDVYVELGSLFMFSKGIMNYKKSLEMFKCADKLLIGAMKRSSRTNGKRCNNCKEKKRETCDCYVVTIWHEEPFHVNCKIMVFLTEYTKLLCIMKDYGASVADLLCTLWNMLRGAANMSGIHCYQFILTYADVFFFLGHYKKSLKLFKFLELYQHDPRIDRFYEIERRFLCYTYIGKTKKAYKLIKELIGFFDEKMYPIHLVPIDTNAILSIQSFKTLVLFGDICVMNGDAKLGLKYYEHSQRLAMSDGEEKSPEMKNVRNAVKNLKNNIKLKKSILFKKMYKKKNKNRAPNEMIDQICKTIKCENFENFYRTIKNVFGFLKCGNPNCKNSVGKTKLLFCSRCMKERYCSKECQKICWKSHSNSCKLDHSLKNNPLKPQSKPKTIKVKVDLEEPVELHGKKVKLFGDEGLGKLTKLLNTKLSLKKLRDPPMEKFCEECDKFLECKRCSNCKSVWFCSKKCQKKNWKIHEFLCKNLKAADSESVLGDH